MLTIYSFDRACEVGYLDGNSVIERIAFVNNNSKLVAITRNKTFITYDIQTDISTESAFEFDEIPTTLLEINNNHSVVGTKSGSMYIIDNLKGTLLSTFKFDNVGIVSIESDENRLYVAFIDGEIKIIDMHSNRDKFRLLLKLNNFSDASKLIEDNNFLIIDESAKKFDEEWVEVFSIAKKLIIKNNEIEAKEIVTPFFFDPQKKDEYIFCLDNIEIVDFFWNLFTCLFCLTYC